MTPGATWPCGPQATRPRSRGPSSGPAQEPATCSLIKETSAGSAPNSDLPVNPGGRGRVNCFKHRVNMNWNFPNPHLLTKHRSRVPILGRRTACTCGELALGASMPKRGFVH